jgi:hypothetical protein
LGCLLFGSTAEEDGMKRGSSDRRSHKKWLLTPLAVGGAILMAASPAYAGGGKIPVTSGNTVPIAMGRQLANMRNDERTCQRTTSPNILNAVKVDYRNIQNHASAELAANGNTLVVPSIGFYCAKSGVPSNITPGEAWVPVEDGNTVANLRHDAVSCVQTADPTERAAVIYDYNINSFAPGTLQDQLTASGNNAVVPPITPTFC